MGLAGLPNVQYNNKQYILGKQMGIKAMVSWKLMQYGRMENCYFFALCQSEVIAQQLAPDLTPMTYVHLVHRTSGP
jgi:hypothetical protein